MRRSLLTLFTLLCTAGASAQELPKALRVGGYVEAFWQWNFAEPSNGVTNYRAFDNRHDSFTLSNVALDLGWDDGHVVARVVGQVGHTPNSYYAAEPSSPATGGAGSSDASTWKYLQQAYLGYRFQLFGRTALVDAGLFMSPIGPEAMAVHGNATWSRSILFYGLPFYHTGARATYELSDRWSVMLAAFNGWNSVLDNNARKSLVVQAVYTHSEALSLSVLYFGGVERARDAVEGPAWRNLFDAHATVRFAPLTLIGHADAGFEQHRLGTSWWAGGALTARVELLDELAVAVRADVLHEHAPAGSSLLFYPARRMGSATATLDYHPWDHISARLEYRRDQASDPAYFRRRVVDGVPNTQHNDTLTVGGTAWF